MLLLFFQEENLFHYNSIFMEKSWKYTSCTLLLHSRNTVFISISSLFICQDSSSSGIIFRFKHYHVLSRIYAFSNSLHQCIITHYYALSFQNSLQFCCKNSFLLHEPTQGLFPKIHRIFVLNSSLIPFFSYLSLRHIYPSWFLCSHGP